MSACGTGDLLAAHVAGLELPSYANGLVLSRYDDPEFQKKLATWADIGQL
jgi:hypothetical protein